jgi:hypothetical protein
MDNKQEDTFNYKGWLISDSFIKRALAVLGYSIVGQFFIFIIIVVLGVILTIVGIN